MWGWAIPYVNVSDQTSIFTHETKMFITICLKCTAVLYSDWAFQMDQMGPKMTLGTLTMSGDDFPGV